MPRKKIDIPNITFTAPVLLAEMQDGQPRRWTARAYNGGPMRVDAPKLDAPLVVDLSGVTFSQSLVANLFHDEERIVGHVTEKQVGGGVLDLAGVVSGGGKDADHFLKAASEGFPWQASIEADQLRIEKLAAGKTTAVNGRTIAGPAYIAKRANVYGVAFLGRGADEGTSVHLAAGAADLFASGATDMNYQEWLTALGLDESTLTDAQKARLKAKYDAEQAEALKAGAKKVDPPAFDLDGLKAAYAKHEATIEAKAAEYAKKIPADRGSGLKADAFAKAVALKAQALQQEWAPQRFEVEAMRQAMDYERELFKAEAPVGPAIHAGHRDVNDAVLQAAICKTAGLPTMEKHFKPEVLEQADTLRGFGLQELLLNYALRAGYSGRMSVTDGNLRDVLKAAFSVHSITTLITQAGNKFLVDGFNTSPQKWREVATTRSVSDFKQVTAFRLTTDLEYEEIGAGGEIQHGTAGQESYTLQAKTYAKMMALTRQDIINDDLGAFNDLRRRLGIGASMALNNKFWTVWLAAANAGTFWTGARGNLVTSSAFADAGIATAVKAFRMMAHPDGSTYHHLDLEPVKVLVGPTLEPTALKYFNSVEFRDTTSSTKFVTANIWQNRFRPVVVPQLENTNYTGYSTTNWWMCADPAILASAVVCFLNGVENPTVESADADFNTLGIQLRGYHDFGVDMSEYRASVEAQA